MGGVVSIPVVQAIVTGATTLSSALPAFGPMGGVLCVLIIVVGATVCLGMSLRHREYMRELDMKERENLAKLKADKEAKREAEKLRDYSTLAASDEFPYHVSIQVDRMHLCSGCLIDFKYVLTVAHCVDRTVNLTHFKSRVKVVVGARVLNPYDQYYFTFNIGRINIHPSFDRRVWKNNIAVLRIENRTSQLFGSNRFPVLPKGKTALENLELLVSGYSLYRPFEENSNRDLHRINMTVFDANRCKTDFVTHDAKEKFCAVPALRYPSCKGDVGSPAIVNKGYTLYIIGIYEQFNRKGCEKENPELFVYVPEYLKFIKSAMS